MSPLNPSRDHPARDHRQRTGPTHDERGQTTAEYALVLLGAAAIATLLVAWATRTDAIGRLFDAVIDQLLGQF